MTGGVAYVTSWNQLNADSVVTREVPSEDALELRALIEEHERRTGSVLAKKLLADWTRSLAGFRQLVPISVAYPPEPPTDLPAPAESLETAAKTTP
jgi:glutamate synthase (NADPH/NADH) large chain